MPELVRADLAYMRSYVEALHEGYSRDNLRAETPEEIARIEREPQWFVSSARGRSLFARATRPTSSM